jgi:hypothetical protein
MPAFICLYNLKFCSQHIFESVKHSLERLQLEYIDLLQCTVSPALIVLSCLPFRFIGHRFDEETPIAETVRSIPSSAVPLTDSGIVVRCKLCMTLFKQGMCVILG